MIKIAAGILLAFLVGFGCRALGLPAPAPPILSGAFLVFAMTLGYAAVDRLLTQPAQHLHNCGGPTGRAAATEGEPS